MLKNATLNNQISKESLMLVKIWDAASKTTPTASKHFSKSKLISNKIRYTTRTNFSNTSSNESWEEKKKANLGLVGELDNKAIDGERALIHKGVVGALGTQVGESTRPPAVRLAMVTPPWSSILKTLRWWEERSEPALLTVASTAWVLDRSPTATEPSLTAYMEYSTWNSRPARFHVVTSVSHWFRNIFFFLLSSDHHADRALERFYLFGSSERLWNPKSGTGSEIKQIWIEFGRRMIALANWDGK